MAETKEYDYGEINFHLKVLDDNVAELKEKVDKMSEKFDRVTEIATNDALQTNTLKLFGEKLEQHIKTGVKQVEELKNGFNKTVEELQNGFERTVNELNKRITNVESRVLTLEQAPLKQGNERWRYITDTVLKGLIGIAIGTLAVMTGLKGGM